MRRTAGLLVLAAAAAVPVAAGPLPAVHVTGVASHRPGWLRIAVRWEGPRALELRLAPACAGEDPGIRVLATQVTLEPTRRRGFLDLRENLAWLTNRRTAPCAVTGLAVELLDGRHVVARAPVALALPPPYPPPTLPAEPGPSAEPPLALGRDRRTSPEAQTSEASLRWSLGPRVAIGLGLERTELGRTMPRAPGTGVRTSVEVGF